MHPLLPKKLAEVKAFAVIGLELFERGGLAATTAFGAEKIVAIQAAIQEQLTRIGESADTAKFDTTTQKLHVMMDGYIGNSWDNSVELLEWSGFYFGGAAVHWALVAGLATDDLTPFAVMQADYFKAWLSDSGEALAKLTTAN